MSNFTEEELAYYKACLQDIRDENFHQNEIEAMIRIYRWTKSDRNAYFFPQRVTRQVHNYKKHIKKLRTRALIQAVRSQSLSGVHRITQAGQWVGYIMLLLRDLEML
ncbi:MAG: hypothetical protein ACFFCI_20855 [Promethearchaeota archaeon]